MKKTVRHLVLLSGVGGVAAAAPFLAIGDQAELFTTATASVAYSDNVLLSRKGQETRDTVCRVVPGLDLKFGKEAVLSGDIFANATLSSYADNVRFNNQLFASGATARFDNQRLKWSAHLSFTELDQPTPETANNATLLEHHDTVAGLEGELSASEKIGFGTGLRYTDSDYQSSAAIDQKNYAVPLNVYYELTPKVDLSTGLTYTRTELEGVAATQSDSYDGLYYNLGARGSFLPKWSGSFSVGFNTRHGNVGPAEDSSVGVKAALEFSYSEKTQLSLGLNRDYANSANGGASFETTDVTLGASSAIAVDWRLSAGLTYRRMEYAADTRDYLEATLGANHVINACLSAGLSCLQRSQRADQGAASEFSNTVVTLSLSARY